MRVGTHSVRQTRWGVGALELLRLALWVAGEVAGWEYRGEIPWAVEGEAVVTWVSQRGYLSRTYQVGEAPSDVLLDAKAGGEGFGK